MDILTKEKEAEYAVIHDNASDRYPGWNKAQAQSRTHRIIEGLDLELLR
jgi:hypothetical protein